MIPTLRIRWNIHGAVQGLGFRPFVYRVAREKGIRGFVSNLPSGVVIEAEGERTQLADLIASIHRDKPALASIVSCEATELPVVGLPPFEIRESGETGSKQALILPDIAVCPDCLREMNDPQDRRFRYPFINCTNCGPRYTIIEALPYDRKHTSMCRFTMCPDCQREYDDPADRRFHAQPNACPTCGPQLQLLDNNGRMIADREEALQQCIRSLRDGRIVAVKGIGGFHLLADPLREDVLRTLRERKHREEKPFALMMPSIAEAHRWCAISPEEERALSSVHAPIVLVKKKSGTTLSASVAPNNPMLGIMLPYAPLHHLIMQEWNRPLIATSANLSDEPICTENDEAVRTLQGIADLFLVHDRPIVRHADDSIIRIIAGREMVMRRGRGLAPLPVFLENDPGRSILAVGGHLKNTVAVNAGAMVFVSQHLGDLETEGANRSFRNTADDLCELYELKPSVIAADKHPEYLSTKYALATGTPVQHVQHHVAHIFSCMAENHLSGPLFGVSWDGTGYGDDGTIWGGEFFRYDGSAMERTMTFRSFPLPGGSAAVKEPCRTALGMLWEMNGGTLTGLPRSGTLEQFTSEQLRVLDQAMQRHLNAPRTSSAGRIFDAVCSLIGLRHRMAYEGQAALELEGIAADGNVATPYPFSVRLHPLQPEVQEFDWEPMVRAIISDVERGESMQQIAARFHETMSQIILHAAKESGEKKITLSGGCFQNRLLTERTIALLRENGCDVFWHQRIPPNDGGLSLGQLYAVTVSESV